MSQSDIRHSGAVVSSGCCVSVVKLETIRTNELYSMHAREVFNGKTRLLNGFQKRWPGQVPSRCLTDLCSSELLQYLKEECQQILEHPRLH